MADKRISELTAASALASADLLMIVQGGSNKKLTAANLFSKINSPVHINESNLDSDTKISGVTDENLVFVDASTDRIGVGTSSPIEKLDIAGGVNIDGIFSNESFNVQATAGVVSQITDSTIFVSLSDMSATLAASSRPGMVKTLVSRSTGVVTLSGANFRGFTTIAFNSIGDSAVVKYIDGGWYILSSNGVVIS